MMMDSTPSSVDPDCDGGGIEFGPYSYNTQTNALEIGTPTVNENGGCGIDDDEADLVLRYLSDDRLGLEDRTSPGDVVDFQKILVTNAAKGTDGSARKRADPRFCHRNPAKPSLGRDF